MSEWTEDRTERIMGWLWACRKDADGFALEAFDYIQHLEEREEYLEAKLDKLEKWLKAKMETVEQPDRADLYTSGFDDGATAACELALIELEEPHE